MGTVYMIINNLNNKKYIGKSIHPLRRIKIHFIKLRNNYHFNSHLQNSFNKYGEENFKVQIIEENIIEKKLDGRERFWIQYFNTFKGKGYNLTEGGEGTSGYSYSKEQLKRMSENHTDVSGRKNPRYGVKLSKEVKRKISKANKGNKPFLNKNHSKETKNKISKIRKEKGLAKGSNNPKAKVDKELGIKIYNEYHNNSLTYNDLINKYPISKSTIGKIVRGQHWTTKNKNPNIQNKIEDKKVQQIYNEHHKNKNISQKILAKKYKISSSSVEYIVNKKHCYFNKK